jgi:sugar lactone lactonase YvrE
MEISRVGEFTVGWGESVVWDEERQRLYFVDCAAGSLHWLDGTATVPETFALPSMPTGVVPTADGRLVGVLDDGLHIIDPDARTTTRVTPYPHELGARGNDACADLAGNIITGTQNLGPGPGSAWRYSTTGDWQLLDADISNTNGPAVGMIDGRETLVIGDTSAHYYAYDYESATGSATDRRVFGDATLVDGSPDGSTLDTEGRLWCAMVGGGLLACFTSEGLTRTVPLPISNPTDVTFGGPGLTTTYVVSISGDGDLDGALLAVDGLDATGRPEPCCHLTERRS